MIPIHNNFHITNDQRVSTRPNHRGGYTIRALLPSTYLNGSKGNDIMHAHNSGTMMVGNEGDDYMLGGAQSDSIYAGKGNDIAYGRLGNDLLVGNEGNDRLFGNQGNDIFEGGDGHDYLSAGYGNDRLDGGSGNDWFDIQHGNNVVDGGVGNDLVNLGNSFYQYDIQQTATGGFLLTNRFTNETNQINNIEYIQFNEGWLDSKTLSQYATPMVQSAPAGVLPRVEHMGSNPMQINAVSTIRLDNIAKAPLDQYLNENPREKTGHIIDTQEKFKELWAAAGQGEAPEIDFDKYLVGILPVRAFDPNAIHLNIQLDNQGVLSYRRGITTLIGIPPSNDLSDLVLSLLPRDNVTAIQVGRY